MPPSQSLSSTKTIPSFPMPFKILAFLRKSLLIHWSYRFALVLGFAGTFANLLMFYFIDRLFGARVVDHLAPYGVSYFSYVLVGIAFSGLIGTSVGAVSGQLHQEQAAGTLEAVLAGPTRVETFVSAVIAWDLACALGDFLLYALCGSLFFGIDFSRTNPFSLAAVTLLSMVALKSLAVLSAAFIMVFKRGDPVSWLISIGAELAGGVYFPVSVLPEWLQTLAACFPLSHAVRAAELAIYQGAGLAELARELAALALFAAFLLPLAVAAIRLAFDRARRDGSLVQY